MINADRTSDLRYSPEIAADFEKGSFLVDCDPRDVPRVLEQIKNKLYRKGLAPRAVELVEKERLEETHDNPRLDFKFSFDMFCMEAGFVKMALAFGHHILGIDWSSSSTADSMRSWLWLSGGEQSRSDAVSRAVWPKPNAQLNLKEVIGIAEHQHLLLVINTNPLVCYICLFGEIDGLIQLHPTVWTSESVPPGSSRGVLIDIRTRQIEYVSLTSLIAAGR